MLSKVAFLQKYTTCTQHKDLTMRLFLAILSLTLARGHWLCDLSVTECTASDGDEFLFSELTGSWITRAMTIPAVSDTTCTIQCQRSEICAFSLFLSGNSHKIDDQCHSDAKLRTMKSDKKNASFKVISWKKGSVLFSSEGEAILNVISIRE